MGLNALLDELLLLLGKWLVFLNKPGLPLELELVPPDRRDGELGPPPSIMTCRSSAS